MLQRRESVTVLVPARDEARTIAPIVRDLVALQSDGIVDQVLVAEHNSTDGTAETASRLGAEVVRTGAVFPELGPVLGKGDNLWRGLTAARGDIVCFVDADSTDFGPHFVHRLVEPLQEPRVAYVKGYYRRPFKVGEVTLPDGGGRVTELTARPLLKLFFPELAAFHQPLAGEFAARRELLERVPVTTGYGVEAALLIDVYREVGIDAMAQVDLDVRQNRHQDLDALGEMATAVAAAILERAGCIEAAGAVERPPRAGLTLSA